MSRTIASYAAKVAEKAAVDLFCRSVAGYTGNVSHADWERVRIVTYKAQFSGRRRRHQYAAARQAKAISELPSRPSHDDAGDATGFTCLYG